ncbi:MAG: alpha/beta fold hydrolase [Ruminococcaceae bacterium]|nr:alpha/beta fold hydrolase [Oscillospiraceae bacterium]
MYWAIGIFLFLSIFYLLSGYAVFRRICVRRADRSDAFEGLFSKQRLSIIGEDRLRRDHEWFDTHRTRDLCTLSHDGLRLFATLIKAPDEVKPRGAVILFHGYRSNARRDFCLQMRTLHEAGYHVIAVDQRSHRRSEGKYICYGIKERHDVVCWCNEAVKLFGKDIPIAIMGLSMGGATVLMASDIVNSGSVKCIIADCPFSSAHGIVSYVMKNHNRLPMSKLLLSAAGFWIRTLADFTLSAPSAAEIVSRSKLPILIFHGESDDYVPIAHSEEIALSGKDRVRLVRIPNAEHAEAVYNDEKKYNSEMLGFLDSKMNFFD